MLLYFFVRIFFCVVYASKRQNYAETFKLTPTHGRNKKLAMTSRRSWTDPFSKSICVVIIKLQEAQIVDSKRLTAAKPKQGDQIPNRLYTLVLKTMSDVLTERQDTLYSSKFQQNSMKKLNASPFTTQLDEVALLCIRVRMRRAGGLWNSHLKKHPLTKISQGFLKLCGTEVSWIWGSYLATASSKLSISIYRPQGRMNKGKWSYI